MTETLTIDRMVARTPDDGDGLPVRIERMMRHVADHRLERTLGSNSFGSQGDWCIRDVAVATLLDLARPDSSLEEAIAQAVLDAITEAMGGDAVVHYPRVVDALAELVMSAGLGRFECAWAWKSIGLVEDIDELRRRPGPCVLDTLAQHCRHAHPAVLRAVDAIGLAPLHRMLTPSGWVRLADIVIDAYATSSMRTDIATAVRRRPVTSAALTASDTRRASWLAGSSRLAASAWASRLRLDGQTSLALAVLVIAESEPAMLASRRAVPLCLALADMVAGTLPVIAERATAAIEPAELSGPVKDASTVVVVSDRRHRQLSTRAAASGDPHANGADQTEAVDGAEVEPMEEPVGDVTHHAGLLFLLNAAVDAAMPETLFDDPELAGIHSSELLARLALSLVDIADDDPAVLAFAGSDATRLRPGWSYRSLPPDALHRIETHAGAWAAATAARLRRYDADRLEATADLVCRNGRIEREQGWVDVHLALVDVDVDVRLAGLDIDPGWVPWVGSVVRFRYA